MKFWIEKDDTIFLYQLVKAAGLEDDYAVIRQIIREGKVSINDQISFSQRQEVKVGDTLRYNDVHIQVEANRAKEDEKRSGRGDQIPERYREPIRHGNTKKWSSKPLEDDRKLDEKLNERCIQIHKTFRSRNLTLALAESCTGGLAQEIITALPGASDFFLGGIVSYSNQIKEKVLQVSIETLQEFGAVSDETATAMSNGVKALMGADIAGSITGIAGPEGGTAEKPVGCVYISVIVPKGIINKKFIFSGSRQKIRKKSVFELFRAILENI